jgi:hypothetical protein
VGSDKINELSRLHATDDAMVWAEEFCRIFAGKRIITERHGGHSDSKQHVDEGTMVGWFANAMQTAVDKAVDRIVDEMPYVVTDRIRARYLLEQLRERSARDE